MKKKILFLMILLILFKFDIVFAKCSDATLSRAKSIVSNVNISYDYHLSGNRAYYDITLTNLTRDIYFVDAVTNRTYRYNNTNNGEITIRNYINNKGSYKFYSTDYECSSTLLGTKYYTLPIYNTYYGSEECKGAEDFAGCSKWVDHYYMYDEFINSLNNYKWNSGVNGTYTISDEDDDIYEDEFLNNLVSFYVKYYYIILIFVIVVCSILIGLKRKKERFNI